jgi:iron complex transport system ATP-binding protein
MAPQAEISRVLWELAGISFSYPGSRGSVLEDFDLELYRGKIYGVLGPNGSGKTTLLDLLCGLSAPSNGKVIFSGKPLGLYGKRTLAQKVAVVPQDFQMRFAFTVREAVEMGCHPHMRHFSGLSVQDSMLVEEVMQDLDISDLAARPVTALSGGEKQRVAAARALVQARDALLLDEATSNLDIYHSLSILNVIRQRAADQGLCVVAAVHDINLASFFCDEFIFLYRGRIAAKGSPEDTLDTTMLQKIYGVEARVRQDDFTGRPAVSFRLREGVGKSDG